MKILEHGNKDTAIKSEWWVGTVMKCSCGCSFELDASDTKKVSATAERRPDGKRTIVIECPECQKHVQKQTFGRGE